MVSFWPIGIRHGRRLTAGRSLRCRQQLVRGAQWPYRAASGRPSGAPHVADDGRRRHLRPIEMVHAGQEPDPRRGGPASAGRVGRACRGIQDFAPARAHSMASRGHRRDLARRGGAEVHARIARELGLDPDVYIVAVGRLVRRKNLAIVAHGAQWLGRTDVHLLVVGDGPEQASLATYAQRWDWASGCSFAATSHETKFQLLAASDIFALPSLHEAFGLVYLEAMHCGLPVTPPVQVARRTIPSDGRSGFLVPPDEPTALLAAVQRLVGNRALRPAMSEAQPDRGADGSASRPPQPRYESLFGRVGRVGARRACVRASRHCRRCTSGSGSRSPDQGDALRLRPRTREESRDERAPGRERGVSWQRRRPAARRPTQARRPARAVRFLLAGASGRRLRLRQVRRILPRATTCPICRPTERPDPGVSCGPGYLVDLLDARLAIPASSGIDSDPERSRTPNDGSLPCETAEAFRTSSRTASRST